MALAEYNVGGMDDIYLVGSWGLGMIPESWVGKWANLLVYD